MLDLDQLQRLAEEAAIECGVDSDWFDDELIESDELISSSRKARRLIAAMSPDTAKKLIAVARAALDLNEMSMSLALFEALEELK